jgi:hypothetical protein
MNEVPSGVVFEPSADGFRLRASCLDFTNAVMRVGLGGVVSSLPFVLWWDLIRGFWTYEGMNFWFTFLFLSIWAAAIAYADWIALMALFGAIRITKAGDQAEVFTGIGKFGWTHRFRWSEFQDVSELETQSDANGRKARTHSVLLQGASKNYKFGWQLPLDRQLFVVQVLREHVYTRPVV